VDAGGRTPTVGALGDAGAIAEKKCRNSDSYFELFRLKNGLKQECQWYKLLCSILWVGAQMKKYYFK